MSFTFNVLWLPVLALIGAAIYVFIRRLPSSVQRGLLPLAFGTIFIAVGIFIFVAAVPSAQRAAHEAAALPYRAGILVDLAPGSSVMLTGVIQPGVLSVDDHPGVDAIVREHQLAAYSVQMWTVEREDETGIPHGRWLFQYNQMSPLTLETDGHRFEVRPAAIKQRNTTERDIYYQRQEWIEAGPDCTENCERTARYLAATYNSQSILHGSLMVSGYAPGDTITVMGTLTEKGVIQPTQMAGGERNILLSALNSDITQYQIGGGMALVVGGIFVIYGLSQMNIGRPRPERISPQELAYRSR